jgi:hypothetical protein
MLLLNNTHTISLDDMYYMFSFLFTDFTILFIYTGNIFYLHISTEHHEWNPA